MSALLRTLYLDPRVGPEILQSLSVGGVDGTTRNRFKGTIAAERVRAKTGTLHGKSCLSGLVGDGSDVLAFSILVEGIRGRHLAEVRGAQVGCVNAMMRYVYEAARRSEADRGRARRIGERSSRPAAPARARRRSRRPAAARDRRAGRTRDPIDAFLRKQRARRRAAPPPAAPPIPAARPRPRRALPRSRARDLVAGGQPSRPGAARDRGDRAIDSGRVDVEVGDRAQARGRDRVQPHAARLDAGAPAPPT